MQRTSRVPDDATLVVRTDRRSAVRGQLLTLSMFAVTVLVAAFGVAATGTPLGVWGVVGVLCLAGWVLEVLSLRSEVALGPALAADDEHLWVRTGGFLRPTSVRLDWPEVRGIALHTWHGRRTSTARYLTFDLVEPVREALAGALDGAQDRRMRRLASGFGSPLAISEQYKDTSLDEVIRGLRPLAPERVRFTRD
ncbi:hypothetical protein [Actinophytocola xanthii]|uniref:Uncharacterized protein n=1 Tax=Actinophytocola xanthii TaxID=1912961 RepID=A0A1Q8CYY7_9PSEU|nr:hypothetical protein [Actinophytocola xanthii]OLF19564.1 hypothetical protein BU204_01185 [Actinophytocola xanthii]